ncbi:ABC transporter ATP-binding protein [Candidatus Poribacteria bacterium]|nr:ABC transporter ATP-binding protein [Candidatus Poribacteria bacterium]
MLVLENVYFSYGQIEALKGINIEVQNKEIVCLIGGNGAGKSTTLMTICGINKPKTGRIIFNGKEIQNLAPHKIVEMGICQVPEGRRILPKLTVLENLEIGGFIRTKSEINETLQWIYDIFPVLEERKKQYGGTLSGGEQQMLAIGRALMARPKLLILDEPSLGLAPIVVSKIFRIIKEINEKGVTVLLVEQNARAALKLANKGYVMETGKIVMHDRANVLLDNPKVKQSYLGE